MFLLLFVVLVMVVHVVFLNAAGLVRRKYSRGRRMLRYAIAHRKRNWKRNSKRD
jgi:hypothetical protein